MVNVDKINFEYNLSETILRDISFKAEVSKPIAILGPSGCGKTTLLKCIYGTLKPNRGTIIIDGKTPDDARNEKKIGVAFQESALIQWRNVKENVIFPNSIGKKTMSLSQEEEQLKEILQLVDLENYQNYYPNELSGGMKQRVNLARALFTNPNLLLLDEPFASLDLLTRTKIALSLKKSVEKINVPSILVTHSIEEAIIFAKKIIILTQRPASIQEELDVDFEIDNLADLEKVQYYQMVAKCRSILMKNIEYAD